MTDRGQLDLISLLLNLFLSPLLVHHSYTFYPLLPSLPHSLYLLSSLFLSPSLSPCSLLPSPPLSASLTFFLLSLSRHLCSLSFHSPPSFSNSSPSSFLFSLHHSPSESIILSSFWTHSVVPRLCSSSGFLHHFSPPLFTLYRQLSIIL